MSTFDVLCVGAVNYDTIAVVTTFPHDDGRMIAEELIVGHGGPAAQAAVTLARLGHRVGFCSSVGDDPEGRAILADLDAEGVDTTHITIDRDTSTARSVVIVNTATGSRSILTSRYRSRPRRPPLDLADLVHVDQAGYGPVREELRTGSTTRVSIDAGNPIDRLDLAGVWLYAPTMAVLRAQFGAGPDSTPVDAATAARQAGADLVVATDGSRGSWWFDSEHSEHVPAVPTKVVSSLGAGDVFHGALLSAVLDSRTPADALRWANTCAALSCRSIDGRSGIPRRQELEDAFMQNPHLSVGTT